LGGAGEVVAGGGVGKITVVPPTTISPGAIVRDGNGEPIPVVFSGDDQLSLGINDSTITLDLPFCPLPGQDLGAFYDPESGLEYSDNKITIPLRDSQGEDLLYIRGDMGIVQEEDGESCQIVLENAVLASEEIIVDLRAEDFEVGQISTAFEVELESLPADVKIETIVLKSPTDDVEEAFDQIAEDGDKVIRDIAYVLEIEKTNLDNDTHLGEATITMTVGLEWIDNHGGLDSIRVLRFGEEGAQILRTTLIKVEGDEATFEAYSPVGLSVFGLSALVLPPTTNFLFIGSTIGGVLLLSIVTFFIMRNRRRARTKRLQSTWSTGLEADDWKDIQ